MGDDGRRRDASGGGVEAEARGAAAAALAARSFANSLRRVS